MVSYGKVSNCRLAAGLHRAWKKCCLVIPHSRFSHQGNNFSVSLDQWVKAQASHLPTKVNKKKFTHLAHGKQNLRPACPKGKQEFKFKFFQPWSQALNVEVVYKCKCKNHSKSLSRHQASVPYNQSLYLVLCHKVTRNISTPPLDGMLVHCKLVSLHLNSLSSFVHLCRETCYENQVSCSAEHNTKTQAETLQLDLNQG